MIGVQDLTCVIIDFCIVLNFKKLITIKLKTTVAI